MMEMKYELLFSKSLDSSAQITHVSKSPSCPLQPSAAEDGSRSGVHSGASSWAPSGDRAIGPPYVTGLRRFLAQIHERKDPWEMQYHPSINQKY